MMASIFKPSVSLDLRSPKVICTNHLSRKERFEFHKNKNLIKERLCSLKANQAHGSAEATTSVVQEKEVKKQIDYGVVGVHHVGLLCENLERSLEFYQNILGLEINEARPHDKLPYRGAWLWVGSEMIHLMELPNPDLLTGRPEHGGRDRHACIAIRDVSNLKMILDKAGCNPEIYGIVADILSFASIFEFVSFSWISRDKNVQADRLAKRALMADVMTLVDGALIAPN